MRAPWLVEESSTVNALPLSLLRIVTVPLDTRLAEDRYRLAALDFLTAEKIFDARWAMTLLDEAMSRLGEEYAAQGKTSTFETLKPFLDPINSNAAPFLRASGKRARG